MLTVGSLFSGIGGLDLGLERAGMHVIWQSEIDTHASNVLAKHWSGTPNLGNVTTIDWDTTPRPDVICGGYPCQPFSLAGYRRGEQDERHLWPYVHEAIGRLRPRYAVLENVRGHLTLGGTRVIADLANLGYCAEWHLVRASAFAAPHRRERLFIVAYPTGQYVENTVFDLMARESPQQLGRGTWADAPGTPWEENQPALAGMDDGVPRRVDRVKALGNAVVPQVAEAIGRAIMRHAGMA